MTAGGWHAHSLPPLGRAAVRLGMLADRGTRAYPANSALGTPPLTSEFARRAIVPADVPLAHYVHYVREAKRVLGKGLG